MRRRLTWLLLAVCLLPNPAQGIDFDREIRPLLADRCFVCHGPDGGTRKAGLRLDLPESATATLESGGRAVVPGDRAASLLWQRITHPDPEERMPPASMHRPLDAVEIERLGRWIDAGAPWAAHWSFVAPAAEEPPAGLGSDWPRGAIDRFVLARLESEGLAPAPEADPATLLRRLHLDLTGLPPTPEDVDAFVADPSDAAWERAIDALLASTRHAEHRARTWLDAARYGDTHGLHLDNERAAWRWRDWVIEAYASNMPYDRFTIEQLAGDLLEEPTTEQLIATGFHRNNVTTSEGGAIDAEYLVEYAVDRVETTGTVWLGMTAGCARCHDHKFDPISQEEFYGLFAFFSNVAEQAMDGNAIDPPPSIRAPRGADVARLAALDAAVADARSALDGPRPAVDAAQAAWEREIAAAPSGWIALALAAATSRDGADLVALPDGSVRAEGGNPPRDVHELILEAPAGPVRVLRLEALADAALPHGGTARSENGNFVLSEVEVAVASAAAPEAFVPVALRAAQADHAQANGFHPPRAIDGVLDDDLGWAVTGFERREDRTLLLLAEAPIEAPGGRIRVRLHYLSKYPAHVAGRVRLSASDDAEIVRGLEPLAVGPWHLCGPFPAADANAAYADVLGPERDPGRLDPDERFGDVAWIRRDDLDAPLIEGLPGERAATYLARTLDARTPRRAILGLGSDDAIKVWLNGHLVHEENARRPVAPDQAFVAVDLRAGSNLLMVKVVNDSGGYGLFARIAEERGAAEDEALAQLVRTPRAERGPGADAPLRRWYRRRHDPGFASLEAELLARTSERDAFRRGLPIALVMREREEPRPARFLERGQYDQPRHEVHAAVPAVLPPLHPRGGDGARADRLDLARWLMRDDHPLVARVTVNRIWQSFFGIGLVRTSEDFGTQGERPVHPRLLDWLARTLIESDWDVRAIERLIAGSATYRQSSAAPAWKRERDPENRLLARGPRHRLDAEVIRDQALAASGLLVERVGGPSVRPWQPEGVWRAVAYSDSNTRTFRADEGDAQHRRSFYTFWKRTAPPPNLLAFDAPSRETCVVRRPRTNTPLQVLVLLNDPQFLEAHRALAARAWTEADGDADRAVERAFRLVLARPPDAAERATLMDLWHRARAQWERDPAGRSAFLAVGSFEASAEIPDADLAATAVVASVILSLDEAVTKG